MFKNKKISFIGAGNMAEALIKGLTKNKIINPDCLLASDISIKKLNVVKNLYKINIDNSNQEAVKKGDIIILSVKPQTIEKVLKEICEKLDSSKLIISIAAGVTIKRLKGILGESTSIIRTMPNTPALIQAGATAISCCGNVSKENMDIASKIFEAVGTVVNVDENLIDAVTGLSGSGPAYIFLIIDALADAGVKMGISREKALKLAIQTVYGSAKLIMGTKKHPGELKDMVTSPGGTTTYGLHALEKGGLRSTLINAVETATLRSKELGKTF